MSTPIAIHPSDARPLRSTAAIAAAFVAVAALSLGTDQILHVLGVYPPWGQPMFDPALNALALAYRIVFTVFGGWLVARLAPRNPMRHAWILSLIGLVAASAGAVAAVTAMGDLGPAWYPIALAIVAFPCVWLGAKLR